MTFPRRAGKFSVTLLLLGVLMALRAAAEPAAVVSDHHTGLAIAGYDPVAYFAEAKATAGRSDLELTDTRGVFRFRNQGNLAAFAANPDVYAPQFSGYDPIALARGIALEGNPLEWEIVGDRLYLFYSPQARAAFKENPAQAIAIAAERWQAIAPGIVP